jgi:hypothetical protein
MPSRIEARRQARRSSSRYTIALARPSTPVKLLRPGLQPGLSKNSGQMPAQSSAAKKPGRPLRRIFLFCTIIFLILIGLFYGYTALFQSTWPRNQTRNFILVPDNIDGFKGKILFAHISPQEKRIQVALLPADLEVNVAGGYGQYPLRSVFPLLKMDNKNSQFIQLALGMGVKQTIDEVWTSRDASLFQSVDVAKVFQEVLSYKVGSRLPLSDRIWLRQFLFSLRPDQIEVTEIKDSAEWEKYEEKKTYVSEKDCSLAVMNTTQSSGLGTLMADIFEKSGLPVIRVSDDSQALEHSLVIRQDAQSCTETLLHVRNIFASTLEEKIDPELMNHYRANMVVLLAKDISIGASSR